MTRVILWMQATVWVLERPYVNDTLWLSGRWERFWRTSWERHQQIFQNETKVHTRTGEKEEPALYTCFKDKMSLRPTQNSVGTSQSNLQQTSFCP